MITAEAFVSEARKLIGTPFRHQGHSASGLDCIGLVYLAAANAGLRFEDLPGYASLPRPWSYSRGAQAQLLEYVSHVCTQADQAMPGTLVLFIYPRAAYPQHFGICTGPTLIHAHGNTHGVVEVSYGEPWLRLTHSIWRLEGVDYATP